MATTLAFNGRFADLKSPRNFFYPTVSHFSHFLPVSPTLYSFSFVLLFHFNSIEEREEKKKKRTVELKKKNTLNHKDDRFKNFIN